MTLLAKWIRKASSIFAEKQEVEADDFGLEHILLYHGLAGSSPENQRQFKDVRSDILSAVSRKNSQNLCIILKIAPLWWEDKLHRIFDEARSDMREQTLASLLPETTSSQEKGQLDPLWHDDWRVRANAANVLNFLQIREAEDRLIESMDATACSTSPAYCHLSRSLAGFQSDKVKSALAAHLNHKEPWIRVDTVNALAKWPLDQVADLLASSFTDDHDFSDYASVAVARAHKPIEFLSRNNESMINLGATILIGAMEAASASFSSNSELLTEIAVQQCLGTLLAAVRTTPSPLRLRALLQLSDWLDKNYHQYRLEAEGYPQQEEIAAAAAEAKTLVQSLDIKSAIESALAKETARSERKSEVRNAVKLAGEEHLTGALPALKEMLSSAGVYQNDVIEAIGMIGDGNCAAPLVTRAKELVSMERRTASALSANPIFEEAPEKAKTYWTILRALGNLRSEEGLTLLLAATSDAAADKREEALSSIIKLCAGGMERSDRAEIKAALQKCLADPSPQVRIKACEGSAIIYAPELIAPLALLINAQEKSVSRAALQALEDLAARGHKEAIKTALTEARKGQSNSIKVKRIDDFIQHHL